MPTLFQKMGISFQYPDNWTLDESDALEGRRSVSIYSPGGAFWTVALYPKSVTPAQLVKSVLHAMREEYKEVEVEAVQETIVSHKMIGYNLGFFCLDFTNSAHVRSFRIGQTTYSYFFQAEDREFEKLLPLFQAITVSLLEGLKKK
jgi:hypothetical protein